MKVEVIKNEEQEITYPCLMEYREGGFIVFFSETGIGVVVQSNGLEWELGHYSEVWAMAQFKPFTGKLVLSNE